MNNTEFRKLLFKGAFNVMACDGEISESEVIELQGLLAHSPYFNGLDIQLELDAALMAIRQQGAATVLSFFEALETNELSEKQGIQLLEVLIKMIQADNRIDTHELTFIYNVRKSLKNFTDEKIIMHFPRYIDLFIDLGEHNHKPLSNKLESADLSAFKDLFSD